ncbi:hypothetical protein LTR95_009380, partial [Oleoguttula sp. CCFEE 5521]
MEGLLAHLREQHDAVERAAQALNRNSGADPDMSRAILALSDGMAVFLATAERFIDSCDVSAGGTPLMHKRSASRSQSGDQSSARLHPLLVRYYDAAGDVKVMGERLADVDYEHVDAATARSLRRDQDLELEQSDVAFQDEYHRRRGSIEHRLDAAIERADLLKAQCLFEGLDLGA